MFHPGSWKKLTDGMYQVNEAIVKNGKYGWACGECKGEPFRLGGREQFPCAHVRFVLRRQEEEKLIEKEIKERRKNINTRWV